MKVALVLLEKGFTYEVSETVWIVTAIQMDVVFNSFDLSKLTLATITLTGLNL